MGEGLAHRVARPTEILDGEPAAGTQHAPLRSPAVSE